jgi:hypothetical protein
MLNHLGGIDFAGVAFSVFGHALLRFDHVKHPPGCRWHGSETFSPRPRYLIEQPAELITVMGSSRVGSSRRSSD